MSNSHLLMINKYHWWDVALSDPLLLLKKKIKYLLSQKKKKKTPLIKISIISFYVVFFFVIHMHFYSTKIFVLYISPIMNFKTKPKNKRYFFSILEKLDIT